MPAWDFASLPALGAIALKERVRRTLVRVVAELMEITDRRAPSIPATKRAVPGVDGIDARFLAHGLRGYVRLVAGMVKANRPWFLARRLYRVLVAALATGAYVIVNEGIWLLADHLDALRLTMATLLSVGAMVVWLVVDHDLWEGRRAPFPRERIHLYNSVTLITFGLGIGVLYAGLFLILLAGAGFV